MNVTAYERLEGDHIAFFRYNSHDINPRTNEPEGLFVAAWRLVDRGSVTEAEERRFWRNRK